MVCKGRGEPKKDVMVTNLMMKVRLGLGRSRKKPNQKSRGTQW